MFTTMPTRELRNQHGTVKVQDCSLFSEWVASLYNQFKPFEGKRHHVPPKTFRGLLNAIYNRNC